MVTKNEEHRHLSRSLRRLSGVVDGIAVYDDASSDRTADVAEAEGAVVEVRPMREPSFTEHEGRFRQAAWRHLERSLRPAPGDWVLCVDADELLDVRPLARGTLERNVAAADDLGMQGLVLPIREVFGWRDGRPLVRVDGFWGRITGCRLVVYRPGGVFPDKALASGSVPTYVQQTAPASDVVLLHLGYATPEDRVMKHRRYAGRPGHHQGHVASILGPATLEPWSAPWS